VVRGGADEKELYLQVLDLADPDHLELLSGLLDS
jgi:hypothetical protein